MSFVLDKSSQVVRGVGMRQAEGAGLDNTPAQQSPGPGYDLCIGSYVLGEMDVSHGRSSGSREPMWEGTVRAMFEQLNPRGGMLLLMEPGTPSGFASIKYAREFLLREFPGEASLVAPCPHSFSCPMSDQSGWCYFSTRLERPEFQRHVKHDPKQQLEDERFSYIVVQRKSAVSGQVPAVEVDPGRLVRPPLKRSGHVVTEVCRSDGRLYREVFARSLGRDNGYGWARDSKWGDSVPFEDASSRVLSSMDSSVMKKKPSIVGRSRGWTLAELESQVDDIVLEGSADGAALPEHPVLERKE
jgi:hypothetical protein